MAVYCKFKSAIECFSVLIEGQFISVGNLKDKIIESKHFGRATDFDLVISNAQTNEEYLDERMPVSKNSSILVRRVPGIRRMPIVIEKDEKPQKIENPKSQDLPPSSGFQIPDSSQFQLTDDLYEDEFGNNLYALPEVPKVLQSKPAIPNKADAPQLAIPNKADEDSKIKAFVDASASEWQGQTREGYAGRGRGYVNGAVGMGPAIRGFGRGMGWKSPPEGYVCHRCNVPGHFIQHCPTNGDTNFDIKRVKLPTGIPKCMLVANPDGFYALPGGASAVLRPNEAAFEEVEGLPSTRSVGDIPPEWHCPLCKNVIKDAVLSSKCCFKSYCDKCIRDHIISKSKCECGATNILADDLLPNKTLRDAINRILETTTSSSEKDGSLLQTQGTSKEISITDTKSGCCSGSKVPSPSLSRCAKQAQATPSKLDVTDLREENNNEKKPSVNVPQQSSEENQSTITAEQLEGTPESMSTKELLTRESVPMLSKEVQQKPPSGESANKKKKKRVRQLSSTNGTQCRASQDFGAKNRMMPYAYTTCNPYSSGIQFATDGYTGSCGSGIPYMGYGLGPSDTSYMPGFVPPVQRDCMDYGTGTHHSAHMLSREEFEVKKVDLRNKLEQQQSCNSNNRTKATLSTDGDGNHTKAKEDREMSMEWHQDCEQPRLSPRAQAKRKADRDVFQINAGRFPTEFNLNSQAIADSEENKTSKLVFAGRLAKKQKDGVLSRISFPEDTDNDNIQIGTVRKNNICSTVRHLSGGRAYYDDDKPVKRIPYGRKHLHDGDPCHNEQNLKQKTSFHRHEVSDERDKMNRISSEKLNLVGVK